MRWKALAEIDLHRDTAENEPCEVCEVEPSTQLASRRSPRAGDADVNAARAECLELRSEVEDTALAKPRCFFRNLHSNQSHISIKDIQS